MLEHILRGTGISKRKSGVGYTLVQKICISQLVFYVWLFCTALNWDSKTLSVFTAFTQMVYQLKTPAVFFQSIALSENDLFLLKIINIWAYCLVACLYFSAQAAVLCVLYSRCLPDRVSGQVLFDSVCHWKQGFSSGTD